MYSFTLLSYNDSFLGFIYYLIFCSDLFLLLESPTFYFYFFSRCIFIISLFSLIFASKSSSSESFYFSPAPWDSIYPKTKSSLALTSLLNSFLLLLFRFSLILLYCAKVSGLFLLLFRWGNAILYLSKYSPSYLLNSCFFLFIKGKLNWWVGPIYEWFSWMDKFDVVSNILSNLYNIG